MAYESVQGRAVEPDYSRAQTGTIRSTPPPTVRPVNPSCFGTIEGAMAESSQTATRVVSMIDRLLGTAPEATLGRDASDPSGLFDVAYRQAMAIRDDMQRINTALDRLESQLP
jgi:hypothetical protein